MQPRRHRDRWPMLMVGSGDSGRAGPGCPIAGCSPIDAAVDAEAEAKGHICLAATRIAIRGAARGAASGDGGDEQEARRATREDHPGSITSR